MKNGKNIIPQELDLVARLVLGAYGYETIWVRIAKINSDGTFFGIAENVDRRNDRYIKGDQYLFDYDDSMIIYTDQQLCYSDNVSICDCPGLCRDK